MVRSLVFSLIGASFALGLVAAPRLARAEEGPAPPPPPKKQAAPDPDRTAALIGSSIGFGLGAAVAGGIYLYQYDRDQKRCEDGESQLCNHPSSRVALVAYGGIVALVPSIPRFVVGDTTKGLLFSALRGISVIAAEFAPWGGDSDTKWQGPFLLGFAAPVALGIVDLATTPRREELEARSAAITRLGPVPVVDRQHGAHGLTFALGGIF